MAKVTLVPSSTPGVAAKILNVVPMMPAGSHLPAHIVEPQKVQKPEVHPAIMSDLVLNKIERSTPHME